MIARGTTALLLAFACGAAHAECAATVQGLRRLAGDAQFPLRWMETSMDDGKPLLLAIGERDRLLHLRFDKTGEGLWAEGTSVVCAEGGQLVVRFEPATLRPGPAAPWLLRRSLAAGARFDLTSPSAGVLRVSTAGWRGLFAVRQDAPAEPAR